MRLLRPRRPWLGADVDGPSRDPERMNPGHMAAKRRTAPWKVLFIGNSFTARNDVAGLIAALAAERGKALEHRAHQRRRGVAAHPLERRYGPHGNRGGRRSSALSLSRSCSWPSNTYS